MNNFPTTLITIDLSSGQAAVTYEMARRNNIEIIDATCPVVLRLQKRIREQYGQNRLSSCSSPASKAS